MSSRKAGPVTVQHCLHALMRQCDLELSGADVVHLDGWKRHAQSWAASRKALPASVMIIASS